MNVRTINDHIMKILEDRELDENSTILKFRIVQTEGNRQVNRNLIHYNLQMIIAVGFKVNNERAVRFRKWSGQIVKDYTIQGWTMHWAVHRHTAAELIVERADAGKISAEKAKLHAETEFEKYRIVQDKIFVSDYDKYLLELGEQAKNNASN